MSAGSHWKSGHYSKELYGGVMAARRFDGFFGLFGHFSRSPGLSRS